MGPGKRGNHVRNPPGLDSGGKFSLLSFRIVADGRNVLVPRRTNASIKLFGETRAANHANMIRAPSVTRSTAASKEAQTFSFTDTFSAVRFG